MKNKNFYIDIKGKLIIGFLIPIILIIIVGITAYKNAAIGMQENYENSATNALFMTCSSFEQTFKLVSTNILSLVSDTEVSNLTKGYYDDSTNDYDAIYSSVTSKLYVVQESNDFISNVCVIPAGNKQCAMTNKLNDITRVGTFIDVLKKDDVGFFENGVQWGGVHDNVDKYLDLNREDYFMYCSLKVGNAQNSGVIVIDISYDSVRHVMEQMDFGEESKLFFVAPNERTLALNEQTNVDDIMNQHFYSEAKNSLDTVGNTAIYTEYVDYDGEEYLFMMGKCSSTGTYLVTVVPKSFITQKADNIKVITSILVFVSIIAAIITGLIIIFNISKYIKASVKRLEQVSKGNLIITNEKKMFGEFGKIQEAIKKTVINTRNLIEKVKNTVKKVSDSSKNVVNRSYSINNMIQNISGEIDEINTNIEKEANEIDKCHILIEKLSDKIKDVDSQALNVINYTNDTKKIVTNGIEAVDIMTSQSSTTYKATKDVKEKVSKLTNEIKEIVTFSDAIEEIALQTSLLSLNASIEAAKAGKYGKGFGVVAEEIGKLADNSALIVTEIRNIIDEVFNYADGTVKAVNIAEEKVKEQEIAVENTKKTFNKIDDLIEYFVKSTNNVMHTINTMESERSEVLESMNDIEDFSNKCIDSANIVKNSLINQISFSSDMDNTVLELENHMKELVNAIDIFILDKKVETN